MALIQSFIYFEDYLDFYRQRVCSTLSEIDIFIKSSEDEMDVFDVAECLNISVDEVHRIMDLKNMEIINKSSFFEIMEEGSSYICGLYKREKECGSPFFYTKEQVAYIYELNVETISEICSDLGIDKITQSALSLVFSKIALC